MENLQDLRSFIYLKSKDASIAKQVEDVYEMAKDTINGISGSFNNYTMHNIGHGIRVAKYMEQLAFGIDNNCEKRMDAFSALEVALLILSAILHDIGMFIRPEDKERIKNNEIKYLESITYEGVLDVKGSEEEAIKEIVRMSHARRINEFINCTFKDGKSIANTLILNGRYSYAEDVALICQAHGENYDFLRMNIRDDCTKGSYNYNPRYLAALLRIADYLDLDKQRTPIMWFSIMGIDGFSKEEWETHFIISNETKLKKYLDDKMQIYFEGESENAKIHRKYLKYIDNFRDELENADNLLNTKSAENRYRLMVTTKIEDNVITKGFEYSDLRLTLDYTAITELLMGKNIYGNSKLGLRELIQNSIDACKLMSEYKNEFNAPWEPSIYFMYSKKDNYVTIKDTGIGMTFNIIKEHFLSIGKSYYKSNSYRYNINKYKPIGQYGIGFLSCFLLSDNIIVTTKHYESNDVYRIELEKNSEYVVTKKIDNHAFYGTEITINYDDFIKVFNSFEEVKSFLSRYFYTDIPIYMQDCDNGSERIRLNNEICDKNQNIYNQKKGKNKILEIDVSGFSNISKGEIYLDFFEKKKWNQILKFKCTKKYLYNSQQKCFEEIDKLEEGQYLYLKYGILSEDEYKKIKDNRQGYGQISDAVYALSKKKKSDVILFIKEDDSELINEYFFPFTLDLEYEGVQLNDIMENSNLPFYPEMLRTYYINNCFIYKNEYIDLFPCAIRNKDDRYYLHRNEDYDEFYIYYKDILINNYGTMFVEIPFTCNIFGYLNYIENNLKLNVARNNIIEGNELLYKEIKKIIFEYLIKFEKNEYKKEILSAMLEKIK